MTRTIKEMASIIGMSPVTLNGLVSTLRPEKALKMKGNAHLYEEEVLIDMVNNYNLNKRNKNQIHHIDGVKYQTITGIVRDMGISDPTGHPVYNRMKNACRRVIIDEKDNPYGGKGKIYNIEQAMEAYHAKKENNTPKLEDMFERTESCYGEVISILINNEFIFKSDQGVHYDCRFNKIDVPDDLNQIKYIEGSFVTKTERHDGQLHIFFVNKYLLKN